MKFVERFLRPSGSSFFLFGPRGTGKTLWMNNRFPDALAVDLLSREQFRLYSGFPERLGETIMAAMAQRKSDNFAVVIDEIQRIPELLDVVHAFIVKFPKMQFIMSGSSARKLRRGGVNLLGGRASTRHMHPFMAAELGNDFDGNRALQFGMLPVVWNSECSKEILASYVGNYLDEEIRYEGLVRKVENFSRFLEVAAFSHGFAPNMSSIARDCGVSGNAVKSYFEILTDLLLGFYVPVFSRRPQRALVTKSKFYFCDTGVYRSLRPPRFPGLDDGSSGFVLEGLIAQHLRAWCDYSNQGHQLFYWQTAGGVEVDFVVHGEDGLWAFEVKASDTLRSEYLHNLKIFAKDYPMAKLCLLYGGSVARKIGDILCLPWDDFVRKLRPNDMGF